MIATVATVAYLGLEARGVEVQCQLVAGLPNFLIVGLADKAVTESRERVQGVVVVYLKIRRNLRFQRAFQSVCPRDSSIWTNPKAPAP